jgi:hypothetical protein
LRVGLVCRVVVVVCATVVMAVVPAAAGARVAIEDGGAGHQAASASLLEVPGPGTVEDRKAKPEAAKSPELLSATATKVEGTPDDGAWQRAESITGFLQRDPHEGAPPSCQIEHLVLREHRHSYGCRRDVAGLRVP